MSSSDESPIFSFSFNAEVLSFFGGSIQTEENALASSIGQQLIPPKPPVVTIPLLQILTMDSMKANYKNRIFSFIQYSVITTGVLISVGLGSYCTYNCLQRLRSLEYNPLWISSSKQRIRDLFKMRHNFNFLRRRLSELASTCRYSSGQEDVRTLIDIRGNSRSSPTSGQDETSVQTPDRIASRDAGVEIVDGPAFAISDASGEEIQTEYFGPALEKGEENLNLKEIDDLVHLLRNSPNKPNEGIPERVSYNWSQKLLAKIYQQHNPKNKRAKEITLSTQSGKNTMQRIKELALSLTSNSNNISRHDPPEESNQSGSRSRRIILKRMKDLLLPLNPNNNIVIQPDEKKPSRFVCFFCEKTFRYMCDLNNHIRIHTGEKPFKCNLCNKSFNQKGNLTTHINVHTRETSFKCKICKGTFTEAGSLKKHMRIHNGLKPYKCEVCKMCFSQSGHLSMHKRMHSGEKPYSCSLCKMRFIQHSDLQKHFRVHTNEKPYMCKFCNKSFSQNHHLTSHMRVHTGEKPYKCDICKKSFSENGSLKKHVRIHSDDRPFLCKFCDKGFKQKGNLTSHLRTHIGEKPYKCDTCEKSFARLSHMKRHSKIHD